MENDKLPHHNVYTRLKCSKIHGIGVFAIKEIPKGVNIFGEDTEKPLIVDEKLVKKQEEEIKKLYKDFCALRNGKYHCPKNFNDMTVSWYLNESKDPNTSSDGYNFYALRDIRPGEELTVDYSTYSE